MKKVVIALGGNALLEKGKKQAVKNQLNSAKKAIESLVPVIKSNQIVITHGNGPEVGILLLQNELARKKISPSPLDVLDAQTEGQIGYLIQQTLENSLKKHKIKKEVVTVLTQVLVSKNDRAFKNPTKFIGPFYKKFQIKSLKFKIKEDFPRGFRRVVASPKPIDIVEKKIINELVKKSIVIAVGGGGIPVVKESNKIKGIEAVIDKDLASACLANTINADTLIIVTDVDKVYLNYKENNEIPLKKVKLKDLIKYYNQGHFPTGSMGPKIEAAINFLSNKGKKVIITNIKNIKSSLQGKEGTLIIK